jgi:hypothetical protein
VADSGRYSAENMPQLNQGGVRWGSRVPEISTAAQAIVQDRLELAGSPAAQEPSDGRRVRPRARGTGGVGSCRTCRTAQHAGSSYGPRKGRSGRAPRCSVALQRQAASEQTAWETRLGHLGHQTFACQPDAEAALAKTCPRLPAWFTVQAPVSAHPTYAARGRPRQDAVPTAAVWQIAVWQIAVWQIAVWQIAVWQIAVWQIAATRTRDPVAWERAGLCRAAFMSGTNLLDQQTWPDAAVIALSREQRVAERGFAFLKDPLFLAP